MDVYIRNCNFIYCISNINYCYDTYLSKTRKKNHDNCKYRSADTH